MEEGDDHQYLDYVEQKRLTDREAEKLFAGIMGEQSLAILKEMLKRERDNVLRRLKNIEGIKIRQISRLTGIGQTTVHNA